MIFKTITFVFVSLACIFCLNLPSSGQTTNATKPTFTRPTYRVTVESLERKANNYTATLIFENLTDRSIKIRWQQKMRLAQDEGPYLIDEKGNRYFANGKDSEGIINEGPLDTFQRSVALLLPRTKLKSRFVFYGDANGETFNLRANEFLDFNKYAPISISNLKVTSDEVKAVAPLPSYVTDAYRVVVDSALKIGDEVVLTLIFESLADNPFELLWGSGKIDYETGAIQSAEPYLIDENADRFYLRKQDSGKIVQDFAGERPLLLPKTKLKTQLTFHVTGNGKIFTLGCRETRPKPYRPIVIENIRIKENAP